MSALKDFALPTEIYAVAILISIVIGALLLMCAVRWTQGFWISFWRATVVTVLAVAAAVFSEIAVFAVLLGLGMDGMNAYWLGLILSIALAALLSALAYAYGVKHPTGEKIGIPHAIKVTFIQLGLSVGVIFAFAFVVALLVMYGVVTLPELPAELQIH